MESSPLRGLPAIGDLFFIRSLTRAGSFEYVRGCPLWLCVKLESRLLIPIKQAAFFLARVLLLCLRFAGVCLFAGSASFERRALAPIAFGGRGFLLALVARRV